MIDKNIIIFLKELKKNNNREWFHENKEKYEIAKKEFEVFVNAMIQGIAQFDKDVSTVTAKDSIFRIFRDVRFSNDKSPYKTNFGAYVVKGGKKSGNAGYYFHIEPGDSFLAGGVYMPPSPVLKSIRQEIYDNIKEFNEIILEDTFRSHYSELIGDKLLLAPKGFPSDFEYIDLLKYKHYSVFKSIDEKELMKEDFMEHLLEMFRLMKPFNDFLNRAVGISRDPY